MNIRNILFILPILALVACSPTDSDSPAPEDVFVKYFGESGLHDAVDIVYNESKSQFFILGSQNLGGGQFEDFFYAIADQGGNLIQQRAIDWPDSLGSRIDIPTSLKQINDDEYLVIGTSTDTDERSFIKWGVVNHDISIDGTYFDIHNAGNDLVAADIIKVANEDNVVILGTASTLEAGDLTPSPQGRQIFMAKRRISDGTKVWVNPKTWGYTGNDDAKAIYEADGGYAVFANTDKSADGFTGRNVLVALTNELGTSDGGSVIYGFGEANGFTNNDEIGGVKKIGNSYKVVGTSTSGTSSQAFIMGITSIGTLDETSTQPSLLDNAYSTNSEGKALARTFDGNYLVMGCYPSFNNVTVGPGITESRLEEMMVLKTNAFGERIEGFDDYYGIESGNDTAVEAITLPDGKVIALGTFDFGSGTTLIGLLKLNRDGKLKE